MVENVEKSSAEIKATEPITSSSQKNAGSHQAGGRDSPGAFRKRRRQVASPLRCMRHWHAADTHEDELVAGFFPSRNCATWLMDSRQSMVQALQALAAAERAAQPHPNEILEKLMADDKMKTGGQDRQRINIHEEYEIRAWTKSLGVTEEALRKAVAEVGDQADKVREHLGKPK